ncbi:MAG: glycosyltransferase [Candidatus Accumulibacter sp.]|nr:glycosyltransferase [Accumulibacter sp.]
MSSSAAPIRTLLFSTLYPSGARPGHGIFVETRLRELLKSGAVETRVVAPVPWFCSTHPRFGDYARLAATPAREMRHGIEVRHPRYFLPPKVGMQIAPFALAAGALPAIRRLQREGFDFDLIDAHYYYPDGVAAALLARHLGKPFVVTARGSDINLIARHAVPRRLMRWAAGRAAESICVSGALRDALAGIGAERAKLRVLRNGVDLARFAPLPPASARAELGWPAAPTLLSVGNLVENKGHHLAIELLALPAGAGGERGVGPDTRLAIVGDGPERAALAALAQRLGVASRVVFAGAVAQERLPAYYSAADVLILASSREGWPNVLLEAMACGTPVVATAVGGVPEAVAAPVAGRLVPASPAPSAAAFATALADLRRAGIDRAAVRRYAEGFGWAETTQGQLALFSEALAGRREAAGAASGVPDASDAPGAPGVPQSGGEAR